MEIPYRGARSCGKTEVSVERQAEYKRYNVKVTKVHEVSVTVRSHLPKFAMTLITAFRRAWDICFLLDAVIFQCHRL